MQSDFIGALFNNNNLNFLLKGFLLTIQVAAVSILLSFLLGALIVFLRQLRIPVFSKLVALFSDIFRNMPLLLIIFFTHFALPTIGIKLGVFWSSVAALTIFEGAMISEIIRSGIGSIDSGQMEAALSSGLSFSKSMLYVVLPQALRNMIPALVSQFIALLKDTSLATIISLPEMMHNAKIIYNTNDQYMIPIYVYMALLYFVVCYALSLFSRFLEKKGANRVAT